MSARPIVFLDVDGVLNSKRWYEGPEYARDASLVATGRLAKREASFDPAAVGRLRRLVLEVDAIIVLTSTTRLTEGAEEVTRFLVRRGFPEAAGRMAGVTPWFHEVKERHREIEALLTLCPGAPFVVLDDELHASVGDRTVICGAHVGLTDAGVERALAVLRGQ